MANEIIQEEMNTPRLMDQTPADERAFFPAGEMDSFRSRWSQIQANFVDDPKHAVAEADQLVNKAMERITQALAEDRSRLESQPDQDRGTSTEDLRLALRRYRIFFDRVLSM